MKESDIRPADVFGEYLALSAKDAETFFTTPDRSRIACIACGSAATNFAFEKHGFAYETCEMCHSLFQSPRPPLREFAEFYRDSPSSEFWAKTFFPALMDRRKHLIFAPRAARIDDLCRRRKIDAPTVMDVGAGHGLFLEEWKKLRPDSRRLAVEPGRELAQICRSKGIEVLEQLAEDAHAWEAQADLVVCFEVIEHAHDPIEFISALQRLAKPGGYVLVSGLGVDGFDVQVLWEHSKSVSPPHHINFMSVEGFEHLFRRAGFKEVVVETPGQLDVDIVRNSAMEHPSLLDGHRFERLLLARGAEAAADFQTLLVKHRMSSHTWVLAQRPT